MFLLCSLAIKSPHDFALGKSRHAESEFELKHIESLHPEAQSKDNRPAVIKSLHKAQKNFSGFNLFLTSCLTRFGPDFRPDFDQNFDQ